MEPVESANRWHQWSVKGTGGVLTQVLDHLDATTPHEWKRLRGEELRPYQPLVRPGSVWYSLETTPSHAGVTLSVERFRDSELRGGRVWFGDLPYPTQAPSIPAAWDQVMLFLDEGIVPAARAAGASIWVPTVDALFLVDLPPDVADRLRKFSQSARKVLPLDGDEAELWQVFVIAAFRAGAVIDGRRFVEWLVHERWERSDAAELTLRFFDQCQLLARYADEVSAA
jgi:hypothetical protein